MKRFTSGNEAKSVAVCLAAKIFFDENEKVNDHNDSLISDRGFEIIDVKVEKSLELIIKDGTKKLKNICETVIKNYEGDVKTLKRAVNRATNIIQKTSSLINKKEAYIAMPFFAANLLFCWFIECDGTKAPDSIYKELKTPSTYYNIHDAQEEIECISFITDCEIAQTVLMMF